MSEFQISFHIRSVDCQSTLRNMLLACQCEGEINKFLATECAAGRVLGPFSHSIFLMVPINQLGTILKSTPGKYYCEAISP